jgi:glucose dehydrogenase
LSLSPPTPGIDAAEWIGRLLVVLQFSLLTPLIWRAMVAPSAIAAQVVALLAASGLLALRALAANRPGNFKIRLTPRHGGTLIESGSYRSMLTP